MSNFYIYKTLSLGKKVFINYTRETKNYFFTLTLKKNINKNINKNIINYYFSNYLIKQMSYKKKFKILYLQNFIKILKLNYFFNYKILNNLKYYLNLNNILNLYFIFKNNKK